MISSKLQVVVVSASVRAYPQSGYKVSNRSTRGCNSDTDVYVNSKVSVIYTPSVSTISTEAVVGTQAEITILYYNCPLSKAVIATPSKTKLDVMSKSNSNSSPVSSAGLNTTLSLYTVNG